VHFLEVKQKILFLLWSTFFTETAQFTPALA